MSSRVSVVIPAYNEEQGISAVLGAIPPGLVDEVVVVDNGSTDRTAERAARMGARVVTEARRGYGRACLAGIAALDRPGIVVFLDADHSDHPEEMGSLVEPLLDGRADFVIGSRTTGRRERGALLPQARFGNWLATGLIRILYHARYTDLGPFRAIDHSILQDMNMQDETFGWTVEMQVKAARQHLRVLEVPVSYRRRVGESKITGTMMGTLRAGYWILLTIFKYRLSCAF
ncbi:MAG: glycosyltransferase family 2 protein [Candidatus Latescibacteria bacterium]|nr:glycosyltransferase family 2 protein [Candidatus Latescibacterota bacterium]